MLNRRYLIIAFLVASIAGITLTFLKTHTTNSQTLCQDYNGIPNGPEKTAGMMWIQAGNFVMGNNKGHKDQESSHYQPFPEEKYEHDVTLRGFWIDRHEVTNAQFAKFVDETGYITIAEQKPKKEWFPPDFPEEQMVAGSAVFHSPERTSNMNNLAQWWSFVEGANWRQPQGPGSSIASKMNHPVVHITQEDALAFAKWAGRELPTEAQWEYAARGGLNQQTYTWGKYYQPGGKWMANTWQGEFPVKNLQHDGYVGTASVGCFPANGYGLYDMAGNVWEIVIDNFQGRHAKQKVNNPTGPAKSFDPLEPGITKHVIKGGSFLCAPNYCMRYRPSARQGHDNTLSTSHIGFRTVLNI